MQGVGYILKVGVLSLFKPHVRNNNVSSVFDLFRLRCNSNKMAAVNVPSIMLDCILIVSLAIPISFLTMLLVESPTREMVKVLTAPTQKDR